MYSVILMAALTTNTADAPAWHRHGGSCYGGIGLHSGSYGSCMGAWGQTSARRRSRRTPSIRIRATIAPA